jgi:dTDP-4-dehydrorhamnose 3,5-epimerase
MKRAAVIDGVVITPLRQILDERGKVMHMLRSTDEHFTQFGEIYFSTVFPDAVKAWHIHKK